MQGCTESSLHTEPRQLCERVHLRGLHCSSELKLPNSLQQRASCHLACCRPVLPSDSSEDHSSAFFIRKRHKTSRLPARPSPASSPHPQQQQCSSRSLFRNDACL